MGPFGVNGKEDRGDANGVLAKYHGKESEAISRWDIGDAGAEGIQEEAGTQLDRIYIERRQATVAQWVALRTLFEVCAR